MGKEAVRAFFERCSQRNEGILLYYTGHGRTNTGDWCFADGDVTFNDIVELYEMYNQKWVPIIYCDCCYSGQWAIRAASCAKNGGPKFCVKTACAPDVVANEGVYARAAWCGVPEAVHICHKVKECLETGMDVKLLDFCNGKQVKKWSHLV